MARTKVDYGIDLGTTNSAIARMDEGAIRIIKSDDTQSDTTPSCIGFNKKKVCFVGQKGLNLFSKEAADSLKKFSVTGDYPEGSNAYIEFKRSMGTDKQYISTYIERSFSSEELSAEVLKKLKSYVRDDAEVSAAVITVPAMFQQHQIAATQKAAELAGFQYCELLQEPIAASMAYGLTSQNANGFWLVFDFGGGTFDAALMRVEEGIIKVHDTSGDNHLGGKNIDSAIVDEILIPHLEQEFTLEETLSQDKGRELLREALKRPAEEIKISFASGQSELKYYKEDIGEDDNGEEIELDLTITLADFNRIVCPIFQRAIDICHKLLERKNLSGNDLTTVVLVGGPTFLETLRSMLREQLTSNIDVSIDPMIAVTTGAALYASTRDIPADLQIRDKSKIQLKLKYPETTVELDENLGIKVERTHSDGDVPAVVFAEIRRKDKAWASGKIEIVDDAEIIPIQLEAGRPNGFDVVLFDQQGAIFPCEPASFTIIQGLKVANATLPLGICAEAMSSERAKQCIIPFKGLEKNKSLPAKGKQIFYTQIDLRPGNSSDLFEIRLYGAEVAFTRALPDEWIGTIPITGDDLPQFLPKDSEVEITLELDSSRRIVCSCYFPYLDESVDKELPEMKHKDIPAEKLESDIERAQHSLSLLVDNIAESDINELEMKLEAISDLLNHGRSNRDTKDEVAHKLGEVIKAIDVHQDASLWPKAAENLDNALAMVMHTQERLGNQQTAQAIEQLSSQAEAIKKEKATLAAQSLVEAIRSLDYHMVKEDTGFWASYIVSFDKDFDIYEWKDRNAAKRLIDDGKKVLATAPSKAKLEEIVRNLFNLMPDKSQPIGGADLSLLRH